MITCPKNQTSEKGNPDGMVLLILLTCLASSRVIPTDSCSSESSSNQRVRAMKYADREYGTDSK